jgi:transglutaminase-like putative cysteine protease
MTSRTRWPETALAGLATAVVSWPLITLFTPNTWVRPTMMMVLVVMAGGLLGRRLTASKTGVVLVQLVVVVLAAGWIYGRGHLWYGLPTVDLVLAFNNLLVEARETIQNYSAPAPSTRGIVLGIGLAIAVTGMVVDHLAVMRRSPALAGLPLLTAFLISASNSGSSLHPIYFVLAAAVWLVMMGRQGIASMRRWSTTAPLSGQSRSQLDRDGTLGFAALGRTLGAVALAAAVALPVVMPHLPTRYLVDGLGRSTDATGFSDGQIGLNTTLDLTRSLNDRSLSPVLSYTTTAPTPTPLRVGVLTDYRGDEWLPDRSDVQLSRRPDVTLPAELGDDVPRKRYRISVGDSRLQAPQLAAPYPLLSGDLDGVAWGVDPQTKVARVNRSAESYTMDYADLAPSRALLEQPTTDRLTDVGRAEALRLERDSAPAVLALAEQVVPAGASRIEAAMAIQEHFRATSYTYSLDLPGPVKDEDGRLVQYDPITHFLRTRTGYCVQFATGMVMLARASGIPARMAIGFLPGTLDKGVYTVRAADAHAWPELYFEGVGWLRFEPTPAARSGQAPPYSLEQAQTTDPDAQPTDTPTTSATSAPRRDGGANDPGAQDELNPTTTTDTGVLSAWWSSGQLTLWGWLLLGLVVGVLGTVAVPLAARIRLRRRLHEAPDDAGRVEVEWQAMVERIGDLGVIAPRGSTPRQAGRFFQREAYLEGPESASLRRVVDTVERSRYAPPGTTLVDIREDTERVVRAVSGVRRRRDRLRALLWPQDGLVEWRERRAAVARQLRRPGEALRTRAGRD